MPHLTDDIQAEAFRLGFQLSGVGPAARPPHTAVYQRWLSQGRQAGMAYLATERALSARADPRNILPDSRSIVNVGMRYPDPRSLPSPRHSHALTGRVASYAWGLDYHTVIPDRLRVLVERIQAMLGKHIEHKLYTDTGPVLERDLAQHAGLGWAGKNTCLINPHQGSYFLLGEVFLSEELPATSPFEHDLCGQCRRCIEACPTACIEEDRTIDARRCISYLTIENKGEIPTELRPQMGEWVFGCDICQIVCPWNARFSDLAAGQVFEPRPEVARPVLPDELRLTREQFNSRFKFSPLLRTKRRGYLRNVSVALGNTHDPSAVPALAETLTGESEVLIRAHAAWALGQIATPLARDVLERCLSTETDPAVLREIRQALDQG